MDEDNNTYVVIEHGATGKPHVHGPFSSEEEADEARKTFKWSRWTTKVEVGVLGTPEHAAYAGMPGRGWNIKNG